MFNFSKQNESTKNKIAIAFCCGMGALYFGLWFPFHSKDVDFKHNMVKRSLNRMESKAAPVEMPKVSMKTLEGKLTVLEQELKETDARLQEMKKRFMPLDSLENLQAMRLEINQLAAATDIQVAEMTVPSHRGMDGSLPPLEGVMKREADNPYGRPLVAMVASATYESLLLFAHGLNTLPYNASIVRLDVAVNTASGEESDGAPQLLDLKLQIAM